MMILIAIGSNLADAGHRTSLDVCEDAVSGLAGLVGMAGVAGPRLVSVSRWYRSAAVPASDQPDYINGVARLDGEIDPKTLLASLQAIERRFGRVRSVPNAARTLDLDIVAMGTLVRDAPDPVLPHPRAHLRGFVLLPLRDVAPEWVEPRSGLAVQALIDGLPLADRQACQVVATCER